MSSFFLPAATLWQRELVRFWRQKSRLLGVIASPLVIWLLIGYGSNSLGRFFSGALVLTVMFSAIFSTISIIEDRREGFLLSMLVSPAPRSSLVLGKILGAATLAWIQGLIFLAFAPLAGVSIGAFEAFTKPRYGAFFESAHRVLPADGRMLLHTILGRPQSFFAANGVAITMNDLRFMRFIGQEIFPGGELPSEDDVVQFATAAGFGVERVHSLRAHYARTLDMWATNLEAKRDEAIAITDEVNYDRFMRYLTGCADFFRRSISDIAQFTLVKG